MEIGSTKNIIVIMIVIMILISHSSPNLGDLFES